MSILVLLLGILFVFPTIISATVSQCSDGTTFTREQAWTCIETVVDTNHDRRMDESEIAESKKYLPWYVKAIDWVAHVISYEHIKDTCDYNKDGYIDSNDFDAMKRTCMPYMDPKNPSKKSDALCKLKKYFCDRASSELNKPVYN